MLQKHALQADSGKYVLEFDSGGEYVQGVIEYRNKRRMPDGTN
jgi:hypothetical protein